MIKQIKDTARSGVTLVELLVVILIVAILAVTMLPMFKKYVVQAQYTAEPIPLVGHIRIQIGLYQYEHNQLPFTYASGSEVFTFEKNTTGNGYKPGYYDVAATAYPSALTAITAETPLQKIDVAMNELVGKKISPDQVHLACVANDTAYCYAIGIFGKGDEGLPLNTGYAVMEAYFPTVQVGTRYVENNANAAENGYKLVATWKNYTGDGTDGDKGIRFGESGGLGICAMLSNSAFSGTSTPADLAAVKTLADGLNAPDSDGNVCGRWEFPEIPVGKSSTPPSGS